MPATQNLATPWKKAPLLHVRRSETEKVVVMEPRVLRGAKAWEVTFSLVEYCSPSEKSAPAMIVNLAAKPQPTTTSPSASTKFCSDCRRCFLAPAPPPGVRRNVVGAELLVTLQNQSVSD